MLKNATELIKRLEQMASEGKLLKRCEDGLKGGVGKCVVYTDIIAHPDQRVSDSGKIVLERGATIGEHAHVDDWEEYTVLSGVVRSGGKDYFPGETMVCYKGESHSCANLFDGESVLRFVKRK